MKKEISSNAVSMEGIFTTPFSYSHEVFGVGFYTALFSSPRLSGSEDEVPIMVSERLINVNEDMTAVKFKIGGQFRSYNRREGERNRLVLYVFARELEPIEENQAVDSTKNKILLDGYICKEPIYRKTPLGREITDILVAVNRPYGKSDYIPCITWGRNARFVSGFAIGTHVEIYGRIQSRKYNNKISETEAETRIAYEVSVSKINKLPYFSENPRKVPNGEAVQRDAECMVS